MQIIPEFYQTHLRTQLNQAQYLILSILLTLLQRYRWVRLEELADKFPQLIRFESRRKKIQRFLDLPQLTIEKIWFPLFSDWLKREFEISEVLYVVIDRTQWGCINLLMVSIISEHRAIPIYFELLPKLGSSGLAEQKALLEKVLPLLKDYKKVVLGDREFCSVDLAAWLNSQNQTYFCLRLKRSEYIEKEAEVWVQLNALGLAPGVCLYFKGVKVTKTKGFTGGNVACKWRRKYRGWTADEGWFILTSLEGLDAALTAYQKRFRIEEMFRDFKSGGYNLEGTKVSGDRLIALILLITLAYSSATMSGQEIKQKGVANYVGRVKEPNRTQQRHSSFYIGLHGRDWVESLEFFAEETEELMRLSPHKRQNYQRGQRAAKLIRSAA